jgi:hypothetical protein
LATLFNEQFDQHGAWRREFALRLKLLAEWLKEHQLLEPAVEERLRRLEIQVRSDKVMVAFVAEFSRGKSELINAIFFAGYGRRIIPTSAGRTTMCPTELGYDPDIAPCLRVLPIETRLLPQSLSDLRLVPERWQRFDLDVNNPQQIAMTLEKVAETRKVSQDEARALGFWHSQGGHDQTQVDANGKVEVPKWRHALINFAHPLLKGGLVILDTPGLNAIGSEPELAVTMIPQANAIVFILGADTGVTQSDLAIWREHLVSDVSNVGARLVVLNKIDTMWDALATPEQVAQQIEKQKVNTATTLGIPMQQVMAVSAHKGLVAKVTHNAELLEQSCMEELEQTLARSIIDKKQAILATAVSQAIADLRMETVRILNIRRRDLQEQGIELKSLKGKNAQVIKHMRMRIRHEQDELEQGSAKIHALRSVHMRMLREIFQWLGANTQKAELAELNQALRQKGIKIGVKTIYAETFVRLHALLQRVQNQTEEIQNMMAALFSQLNTEYGFSLQALPVPSFSQHRDELKKLEQHHVQYLSLSNALKLTQTEFVDRLVRGLSTQLRAVFEATLYAIEVWSKSADDQLEVQLRDRKDNFTRRLDAINNIQTTAESLSEQVQALEQQSAHWTALEVKLYQLTERLMQEPAPA